MSTASRTAAQILSISVSLIASGGIATLSLFDVPELRAQPASRSLPSIRWLFSRGSHIFPSAAFASSAGFLYLALAAVPASRTRALTQLIRLSSNSRQVNGYLAAAVLTLSIGPWTSLAMIPTNFELIKMNEDKGGARSAKSAQISSEQKSGGRSALDSVNGEGQAPQFTDLSGPQTQTARSTTEAEDEKVRGLLDKFSKLNYMRAVLMASGGMIGLWAALL